MPDNQNPNPPQNRSPPPPPPPPPSPPPSESRVPGENGYNGSTTGSSYGGLKHHYPNRPDATNPDAATLREQWRFATRQYSRWYSQAWGAAILAGLSFFALGWIIKGSNPLPSLAKREDESVNQPQQKHQQQQNNGGHDIPKS